MVKTRSLASKCLTQSMILKQPSKREYSPEDQISQLPEEILIFILSFLTLKEAAQTSVLSSRWMKLWTQALCLDFDATDTLQKTSKNRKILGRERRKYISWVNRVLHSHKGKTLEKFRIYFDLIKSSQKEIDKWLEYAFERKVKRLEINLSVDGEFERHIMQCCEFPDWILNLNCGTHHNACCDLKSLKEFHLQCLNVTSKAVEFLLLRCPFLERLVIIGSGKLTSLVISGPQLVLKHLEIKYCFNLQSITICNSNLVTLKISYVDKLIIRDNPMLSEVRLYNFVPSFMFHVFSELSCRLSQLEVLELYTDLVEKMANIEGVPELRRLKELVLSGGAKDDGSLMGCISFLKFCPNLKKFVLRLHWLEPSETKRELEKAMQFSLKYLEVIELVKYHGGTSENELIMFFLENAVALEKIIVHPWPQCFHLDRDLDDSEEQAARVRSAQRLEGLVPNHIKLVILGLN